MEKSFEKSQEQADIIKMIAIPIMMLDTEYCKEIAQDMRHQASRQETLAILNPSHNSKKNTVLRLQSQALSCLVKYVETLKQVEEVKKIIALEEDQRSEIAKLFL